MPSNGEQTVAQCLALADKYADAVAGCNEHDAGGKTRHALEAALRTVIQERAGAQLAGPDYRNELGALMTWLAHNLPTDVWIRVRRSDQWGKADAALRAGLPPPFAATKKGAAENDASGS